MFSSVSLSCHAESHSVIYTSWYIYCLFYLLFYSPFAMTFFAWVLNFYSLATTLITDDCLLHNSKYTSRCSCYISRSMTGATFFWFFSIFCSMAMAGFTVYHLIKMYLFFYTGKALSECYMYFLLYVFSTFVSSLSSTTSKATHISKYR